MNENRADTQGLHTTGTESKPVQALDSGTPGEQKGRTRITVRFVRCSTRSLDPVVNLPGSFKALEDLLRYCGLIEDDRASEYYRGTVEQTHVVTRKEHQTKITLEYEEVPLA